MQNRQKNKENQRNFFFHQVKIIAKALDVTALKELFKSAGFSDVGEESYFNDEIYELLTAPVIHLAETGAVDAVNFLLGFRSNLKDEALEGYARANNADQVNLSLMSGATFNRAVFGAACGGHEKLVQYLLAKGGKTESAISGYARGGFEKQVKDLLTQDPGKIHFAVYNYACGGHFKLLEDMLRDGGDLYDAMRGFSNHGYFDDKNKFLYLLTMLTNRKLQLELTKSADNRYPRYFRADHMLRQSVRLKKAMQLHHLSYNQAVAWMTVQFRVWLLQGVQLVLARRLPLDIVLNIAAYIPECQPLTLEETLDVRRKFTFQANKLFVSNALNNFALINGKRKKRAESLAVACKKAQSGHHLKVLLRYQQELFEKAREVMPNRHRPAHEQPFESGEADQFTTIVDRYYVKLS